VVCETALGGDSGQGRVSGQARKGALRRSLGQPGFVANHPPGSSAATQGSNPGSIHDNPRSSKLPSLRSGIPQAGTNALGNQATLQLGDREQNFRW
jgi:hypothetical protein